MAIRFATAVVLTIAGSIGNITGSTDMYAWHWVKAGSAASLAAAVGLSLVICISTG